MSGRSEISSEIRVGTSAELSLRVEGNKMAASGELRTCNRYDRGSLNARSVWQVVAPASPAAPISYLFSSPCSFDISLRTVPCPPRKTQRYRCFSAPPHPRVRPFRGVVVVVGQTRDLVNAPRSLRVDGGPDGSPLHRESSEIDRYPQRTHAASLAAVWKN